MDISVLVTDVQDNEPIAGATVTLIVDSTELASSKTGGDGTWGTSEQIEPGEILRYKVEKEGYKPHEGSTHITATTVELNITLERESSTPVAVPWPWIIGAAVAVLAIAAFVAMRNRGNDNGGPPPTALVADFSLPPASGFAALEVQFKDISTGSPTKWTWEFGDGSPPSNEQHPVHTYADSGYKYRKAGSNPKAKGKACYRKVEYKVKLTVENASGESATKTDKIDVKPPYYKLTLRRAPRRVNTGTLLHNPGYSYVCARTPDSKGSAIPDKKSNDTIGYYCKGQEVFVAADHQIKINGDTWTFQGWLPQDEVQDLPPLPNKRHSGKIVMSDDQVVTARYKKQP